MRTFLYLSPIVLLGIYLALNSIGSKTDAIRNNAIETICVLDSGVDTSVEGLYGVEKHSVIPGSDGSDAVGHGTFVSHLIQSRIGLNKKYKFVSIQVKKELNTLSPLKDRENLVKGIVLSKKLGCSLVNISMTSYGDYNEEEFKTIESLRGSTAFIVAAGNDGVNLDLEQNRSFPGSYNLKNVFVIGNGGEIEGIDSRSNFGSSVYSYVNGRNVSGPGLGGGFVIRSGSSVSAAIFSSYVATVGVKQFLLLNQQKR